VSPVLRPSVRCLLSARHMRTKMPRELELSSVIALISAKLSNVSSKHFPSVVWEYRREEVVHQEVTEACHAPNARTLVNM
jgi:hypothetical protein